MTYREILNDAINVLENSKINDAKNDAKAILLHMLDMDMARYLYECDIDLETLYSKSFIANFLSDFNELITVRSKHYPLQYILGETYFCGLRFAVNSSVLIPRSDTEILVEKVLSDNNDKNINIIDMCTGSGCIATALSVLGNYKNILATDISDEALEVAKENADNLIDDYVSDDDYESKIYFLKSDMFSNIDKFSNKTGIKAFDILVSNPPYIKTNDIKKLDDEVKRFEPMAALDGDMDGMKFYKIMSKDAKKYLNDNAKIYLEIGYDEESDVKNIFVNDGYKYIETVKDLNNQNRVMVFLYNKIEE